MSAWLAGLLATLAEKLIMLIGHDLADLLAKREAVRKAQAETKAAAEESVAPLVNAKNPQEERDAVNSALDGF